MKEFDILMLSISSINGTLATLFVFIVIIIAIWIIFSLR